MTKKGVVFTNRNLGAAQSDKRQKTYDERSFNDLSLYVKNV